MSLVSLLLLCVQGSCTWLVPFLIALKLQLAPMITSFKLWWQARCYLCLLLAGKMLASKLICYFFKLSCHIRIPAGTPSDNTILNVANKRTDQSYLDFWTGIGASAETTLEMEKLISNVRTAIVNTITSWQDSNKEVIPVLEVHDSPRIMTLCTRMSLNKLVIWLIFWLSFFLNSALRQHCEVCTLKFPFLNSIKDTALSSEACLYGHINWILAKVHQ